MLYHYYYFIFLQPLNTTNLSTLSSEYGDEVTYVKNENSTVRIIDKSKINC